MQRIGKLGLCFGRRHGGGPLVCLGSGGGWACCSAGSLDGLAGFIPGAGQPADDDLHGGGSFGRGFLHSRTLLGSLALVPLPALGMVERRAFPALGLALLDRLERGSEVADGARVYRVRRLEQCGGKLLLGLARQVAADVGPYVVLANRLHIAQRAPGHNLRPLWAVRDHEPGRLARSGLRHISLEALHGLGAADHGVDVLRRGRGLDGVDGDHVAIGQPDLLTMLEGDNIYIQPALQGRTAGSTVAVNMSLCIRWDGTAE